MQTCFPFLPNYCQTFVENLTNIKFPREHNSDLSKPFHGTTQSQNYNPTHGSSHEVFLNPHYTTSPKTHTRVVPQILPLPTPPHYHETTHACCRLTKSTHTTPLRKTYDQHTRRLRKSSSTHPPHDDDKNNNPHRCRLTKSLSTLTGTT